MEDKRKIIIELTEDEIANEELLQIICATAMIKKYVSAEPQIYDYPEFTKKKERQLYRLSKKLGLKLKTKKTEVTNV